MAFSSSGITEAYKEEWKLKLSGHLFQQILNLTDNNGMSQSDMALANEIADEFAETIFEVTVDQFTKLREKENERKQNAD